MAFKVGDAVVHPVRGAGVIMGTAELRGPEHNRRYYKIKLLRQANTSLMVPVEDAEERGLRPVISEDDLGQVWNVFDEEPKALPERRQTRYKLLREKLMGGDVYQVAEAVRDMSWRREEKERLSAEGKRLYKRSLGLLASEIAAAKEIDLDEAEALIKAKVREKALAWASEEDEE
jgi:CarD family transcriptional regulator